MSRRVMNLAHLVTQNARRHGDRPAFHLGRQVLDLAQIDAAVSAAGSGFAARGVGKGDRILVHSQKRRRDVLVDVRGLSPRGGLGSHQLSP